MTGVEPYVITEQEKHVTIVTGILLNQKSGIIENKVPKEPQNPVLEYVIIGKKSNGMNSSNNTTSPEIKIHFLGRFRVFINGNPINEHEIKGRKARSLIKLITHQRQHQIVRDQAIDILWPDLDTKSANTQLYKALHHIRKAFSKYDDEAANWLEFSNELIRFNPPGELLTDLMQFEQAAKSGLREQDLADLEQAASLYSGDFLPMDRYANWASMPRDHYRQLYLDVLSRLAKEYEKQNKLPEAAELFRLALDKELTLETAHCGLMRIFARKGQTTRSFHQYDVCRKILGEELGVSPSPETKQLLNKIREGQFRKKSNIHEKSSSLTEPSSPIIGHTEERTIMQNLLTNLETGKGNKVLICGEAGIGKTRLVQEIIQMARQIDVSIYPGNTITGSGNMAYSSFIELFKLIIQKHPDLEKELPVELKHFIPGISTKGAPIPHADKLAAKSYLFSQVHQLFSKLVEGNPSVMIFEDLHEADQASRELFAYLLNQCEQDPVLFIATYRKEDGEALPDYLTDLQKHSPQILELAPLTYEEHINLLHTNAGSAVIGAETAGQIYQLAEGNPLYTIELLQNYIHQYQKDTGNTGKQYWATEGIPYSINIPDSIHHMVQQKLDKVSPAAQHLLYIASIIGREVPFGLLASVWANGNDNRESGLFNAVEEVIEARILEEQGLDYIFRHALVQETIYASISEARRRILHKQIANRLLEFSSEDSNKISVEKIAYHFLGAKDYLNGTQYLIQAGERAEKAYAHEDALIQYQKADSILDHITKREALDLRCNILHRIGDVYRASGRLELSFDAYRDAISVAEECSLSNREKIELYRKMSVAAIFRTDIDQSKKYLDKAFSLVDDNNLLSLARLSITKALHLWHLNQLEEAYDVAQTGLEQARKTGASAETSQAYEILAMICLPLGRWEEGLQYEMERKEYGWSPEIVVATDAHLCLWEYHVSGDQPLQHARNFMEKISEQAIDMGDLRCVAVCHYALGTMHLWRGDRHHAVEELSSSLELHEKVGSRAGMAYSLARKSVLHTLMGAKDLGWQAVKDGITYAGQAAVRDHCLQRLYGVGIWNRLEAEDHIQAQKLVNMSEQLLDQSGACAACALELYPWLAYYHLQSGQVKKARKCGEEVAKLAEATGNPIGKAISSIIESNLSVVDREKEKSDTYREKSYEILAEAVPQTSYSPVVHYINRMVEQQKMLV